MPSEPKTDRPTGTIFELDIFREKLERAAAVWQHEEGDSIYGAELGAFAAELKTLIDNCMKQYVHTASPESDGATELLRELRQAHKCFVAKMDTPKEFEQRVARICDKSNELPTPTPSPPTPPTGDCDACGKTFAADDLTFQAYGEGGNHVADGSFCPDCNGTPLDPPPTELHIDPQNQEGVELADNFDSVSGEVAARNLAARLNASPPTEGGAEEPKNHAKIRYHASSGRLCFEGVEVGNPAIDVGQMNGRTQSIVDDLIRRVDLEVDAAYAAGASTRRPAGDDGPCQHATTDDLYEAEAFIRNNGGSYDLAYKLECLALDIDEGRCPASTRGSGEAAGHLVEELRRLAEVVRVADTQPAAIDLHGAASDITAVANQLAQNPSRGSDGLEEAAKELRSDLALVTARVLESPKDKTYRDLDKVLDKACDLAAALADGGMGDE